MDFIYFFRYRFTGFPNLPKSLSFDPSLAAFSLFFCGWLKAGFKKAHLSYLFLRFGRCRWFCVRSVTRFFVFAGLFLLMSPGPIPSFVFLKWRKLLPFIVILVWYFLVKERDGSSPFSALTEVIELSDRNAWWFLVPTGLPIPRRLCPLTWLAIPNYG